MGPDDYKGKFLLNLGDGEFIEIDPERVFEILDAEDLDEKARKVVETLKEVFNEDVDGTFYIPEELLIEILSPDEPVQDPS